jgi:hypothetical protein
LPAGEKQTAVHPLPQRRRARNAGFIFFIINKRQMMNHHNNSLHTIFVTGKTQLSLDS